MIPSAVFIGSLRMLDVLQAEEALASVSQIGIGTGAADQAFRQRQMIEWEHAAGILSAPTPLRKLTKEKLQRHAAMGMGLDLVPKRD